MKKRTVQLFFIGMLSIILLAGCGSSANNTEAEKPQAPAETVAEGDVQELVITASNWEFDQEVYEVKAGSPVKVSINNAQGYHTLKINGIDVEVKPNEPAQFTAEPGEYEIICSIPCGAGHAEMKSTLVVN
ncbi:cupredoxin domain-containing protein [Caldalkalibacillus mannanilyticus]|uniref:cupredoxin domain-containing protein n=1 Tax=Caldalkalibacillus mannanilyticus TaxID=1418 RepID=UPI0004681739|nr:cupredoxin domain-containing protein [Caldalkalibacillus mannanilyticus]